MPLKGQGARPPLFAAQVVQVILQHNNGGQGIDRFASFLFPGPSFDPHVQGLSRGKPFIPENNLNSRSDLLQVLLQLTCKRLNLAGLRAHGAVHVFGKADNHGIDLGIAGHFSDASGGLPFLAVNNARLGGEKTGWITQGDTNPGIADIESHESLENT